MVEIGCVELINRIPTGQTFQRYLNPERDIPAEAFAVHGLAHDFLRDKPLFGEVAAELLEFIGEDPLVIHNAGFDIAFLNSELDRARLPALSRDRLVDTLTIARRKFPGGPNRLDDLCARYGIDRSRRVRHGALLDAEILAEVYLELIEARQAQLGLAQATAAGIARAGAAIRLRPVPLAPRVTAEERIAHRAFIATLGASAIWHEYIAAEPDAASASTGG